MHHKQSEMKERVVTRSSLTTDQQHPQRATETGHPPSWINNNLDTDLAKQSFQRPWLNYCNSLYRHCS